MHIDDEPAAGGNRSRLFVYNGGFLTQRRVRRILSLAGYDIRLGLPGEGDLVGIWGNSPTAHRGRAVAQKHGTGLLRVEDAFLRSLQPGRSGEPPLGLCLDLKGVHFDPAQPSALEELLANEPLDDAALLTRARDATARLRELRLSKYSGFDPDAAIPDPGYVLVVDQTREDASVPASNGTELSRELFGPQILDASPMHPAVEPDGGEDRHHGHGDQPRRDPLVRPAGGDGDDENAARLEYDRPDEPAER